MAAGTKYRRKSDGYIFGPLTEAQARKGLAGFPEEYEEHADPEPLIVADDDNATEAKPARRRAAKPAEPAGEGQTSE